ncbi:MAG: hypothetical protein JST81_02700 [Bacteroidetes bacterium]|nr:hypothetical protein [Bacteroidota bacterium]
MHTPVTVNQPARTRRNMLLIKIVFFLFISTTAITFDLTASIPGINPIKELIERLQSDSLLRKKYGIKDLSLLQSFYENNHYQWQWYNNNNAVTNRKQLIHKLSNAKSYAIKERNTGLLQLKCNDCTLNDSLISEIKFSNAGLTFFKDLAYSDTSFVSYNGWHYSPDCNDISWMLQKSIESGDYDTYIKLAEPSSDTYRSLKKLYAETLTARVKTQQKKIYNQVQWQRWISCMEGKSYLLINLASSAITLMEAGKPLYHATFRLSRKPAKPVTVTSILQPARLYFDDNYPSSLQFDFDNPYQLTISGSRSCTDGKTHIIVADPDKLLEAIKADTSGENDICTEEACPYTETAIRSIPVFIIDLK